VLSLLSDGLETVVPELADFLSVAFRSEFPQAAKSEMKQKMRKWFLVSTGYVRIRKGIT
jgi:hypothetical protein